MNNVDYGIEKKDIGPKNDCFLEDNVTILIWKRGPTPFLISKNFILLKGCYISDTLQYFLQGWLIFSYVKTPPHVVLIQVIIETQEDLSYT